MREEKINLDGVIKAVATIIICILIIVGCYCCLSRFDKDVRATVFYQGHYVTYDTGNGDKVIANDSSEYPVSIFIDGEWKKFGYSLVEKIEFYDKDKED